MARAALAVAIAAAILGPWAFWDPPPPAPTSSVEPGLPDRVLIAPYQDQLPFACPVPCCCCSGGGTEAAMLVQKDAIWIGSDRPSHLTPPVRIARDGREWAALESALRRISPDNFVSFQIAASDDASYEDLLLAMLLSRKNGLWPHVITPALPVHPNHGWGGGMGL